ncbi:hypothetical protein E2562_017103 [Oryza meyeriana var. granulata]|uniref:Uncharacterized protein n=1 Tax=Oryza meyeriana var. granulata TaxID=110450 RepID=A0A6G1DWH0_9ORYZ|nr:hypothetical protein E2562_017103 [Oryza meyeriana var. granulata]
MGALPSPPRLHGLPSAPGTAAPPDCAGRPIPSVPGRYGPATPRRPRHALRPPATPVAPPLRVSTASPPDCAGRPIPFTPGGLPSAPGGFPPRRRTAPGWPLPAAPRRRLRALQATGVASLAEA